MPLHVFADSAFSIDPAFSQIELSDASQSASLVIHIGNSTKTDQTFELKAVDIQQVDSDGNVQLSDKPQEGNALSFASYVRVTPETVEVPAGKTIDVTVLVQNSNDLSPGGHYAAVLLRGEGKETASGQTVIPALTSFLLVNKKGGEKYHISLGRVDEFVRPLHFSFPKDVVLRFHNEGNTHVSPFGTIFITDLFNRTVRKGIINEGAKIVLPQTDRDLITQLKPMRFSFPFMIYRVKVVGTTKPGDIAFQQESSFVFLSPFFGIGTIIGIGACLFFVKRWRKKV